MKRKSSSGIIFIVSALIVALLAYTLTFGLTIFGYRVTPIKDVLKLGLDLRGGVYIEEEIKEKDVSKDTLERTKQLLEMRVRGLGVTEASVAVTAQKRIRIEIPGIYNAEDALKQVGKTGKLAFIGPNNDEVITGKDVEDALVALDTQTNQPIVQLKLNKEGAQKFYEATKKYKGQIIKIQMDDEVISSPTVASEIPNGEAQITGSKNIDEAKYLAGIIKSGALPVTLEPATVKTIGASLGAEAIPTSKKAAAVGVALVMIFMILYYKIPGLIADIALSVYIILSFLIFIMLNATLTLPGIAGFLLSIGMAVDANVLIFERIKEELKVGKSLNTSVDSGFHRALSSIVDSNITTLIASFILMFFGSGSVKGFAITLTIGVFCSMLTAITVTKFLLKSFIGAGWVKNTMLYRPFNLMSTEKTFRFFEFRKIWFSISIALIIISMSFFGIKGLNYGIDFKGGTVINVRVNDKFDIQDIRNITAKYDPQADAREIEGYEATITSQKVNTDEINKMVKEIKDKYPKSELLSTDNIGPTVGSELRRNALISSILAALGILAYVSIRFEFKSGLAAVIALIHDLLITVGVFAVFKLPVNSSFLAAILTILGYSINDTIVIFDRIRENLRLNKYKDFTTNVNASITQTLSRSINTMLTTLFTIACVYIFGVQSVKEFAFPLLIGIVSGGYSSIFIAAPLWVMLEKGKKPMKI